MIDAPSGMGILAQLVWFDRLIETFVSPSHNLRVIFLGVTSLGLSAGICGCFLLFRKRSLLSDTIGHSTLPGVALAFLLFARFFEGGKNYFALMLGALVTGWLSVRAVQWIKQQSRIREDAALAISLTFFYGVGVVLLSVVQSLQVEHSSGLEYYLYGMVASMVESEARWLLGIAVGALVVVGVFFKELNSLCFDEGFVATQGLPNRWLDEVLMLTCLVVTIGGLQTVGLLMIMALFIIPPATARLWTDSMTWTLVIAAGVGATGALVGSVASAVVTNLPAGAAIILATALLFAISMLVGTRQGWLVRKARLVRLEYRLTENQFLRAVFDSLESQQQIRLLSGLDFSEHLAFVDVAMSRSIGKRGWSEAKEYRIAKALAKKGLLSFNSEQRSVKLTQQGLDRSIEAARTHRLTELYLLEHAEIAPAKVHQYVERIEEVTTPEIARDLRKLFRTRLKEQLVPMEPHVK